MDIKVACSKPLNSMPISKMKLSNAYFKNLKDEKTLAFYNISNGYYIDLKLKERGGRTIKK